MTATLFPFIFLRKNRISVFEIKFFLPSGYKKKYPSTQMVW